MAALEDAAGRGVAVRVIYNAGAIRTIPKKMPTLPIMKKLEAAGFAAKPGLPLFPKDAPEDVHFRRQRFSHHDLQSQTGYLFFHPGFHHHDTGPGRDR
jgi:hypothetical protein